MVVALAHRRPRRRGPLGDVRAAAVLCRPQPLAPRRRGMEHDRGQGDRRTPAYARSSPTPTERGTGEENAGNGRNAAAQPPGVWTVNEIPSTPWVHFIRRIGYVRPGLAFVFAQGPSAPPFLSLRSSARPPVPPRRCPELPGRREADARWCLWLDTPAVSGTRLSYPPMGASQSCSVGAEEHQRVATMASELRRTVGGNV
jgi:hypothetical protein